MNWTALSIACAMDDIRSTAERTLREYQELDLKIEKLTGHSLGNLERLFAAGWTLEPPKKPSNVSDLADLA